jgi:ubiquinone/menaquinone biosynthesis C-methylase UbiE
MSGVAAKVNPVEGHRLWSSSYDRVPNPLLALEQRFLLPELGSLEGRHLLDVGCGTGRWMGLAQERGAAVAGVDLTPEILVEAAQKACSRGRIALGHASLLPFVPATFDLVVCAFVWGYLDRREESIRELARVVKPGGRVVMSDLHPEALKAGWTSSFREAGAVYEIERRRYALEEIRDLGRCQGLREKKLIEAHFDAPEIPVFLQAGKAEQFDNARKIPAIVAVVWER